MPRASKKPCQSPGCSKLTLGKYCEDHKSENLHQADRKRVKDKRYNSRRWFKLRAYIKRRDPICTVEGCIEASYIADHFIPVEEGGDFWDEENLRGMCNYHHNVKRAEESRRAKSLAYQTTKGNKIIVVWGAPGSGKTRYVLDNMAYGDMVIDLDIIHSAISFSDAHQSPHSTYSAALFIVKELRKRAILAPLDIPRTWIVTTEITDELFRLLQGADYEERYLKLSEKECLDNIESDTSRPDKQAWREIVREWYAKDRTRYSRLPGVRSQKHDKIRKELFGFED